MIQLENVRKEVLKFGGFAMIGMMVIALYNLVDAYFVSGLGTSAIGALSVVFPVSMGVSAVGFAFGTGSASYVSRLLGEDNRKRAEEVLSSSLFAAMLIGGILIGVVIFRLETVLKVFGAAGSVLFDAKQYGRIILFGSFVNIFTVTLNHNLRAQGFMKESMISMAFGSVLNMLLDPLLIYSFDMGIRGAAYATVLAQTVSVMLLVYIYSSKTGCIKAKIGSIKLEGELYFEVLKIGIPVFLYQALSSMAMAFINRKAVIYGDEALVAMGVMNRIIGFMSYLVFGFVKGLQPIAGFAFGRKRYDKVREALGYTIRILSIYCLVTAVSVILFRTELMTLFSDNPQVLLIGSKALAISSVTFISLGYQMSYVTLFMSLGKAKEGSILGLSRQGFILIPVLVVAERIFGLNGVLYAQAISDILVLVMCFFFASRVRGELKMKKQGKYDSAQTAAR